MGEATLYVSALGTGSFSPSLLLVNRCWLITLWPICKELSCPKLHDAVIRVYDDTGNAIETHEHKGDFSDARFWSPLNRRLSRLLRFRCHSGNRRSGLSGPIGISSKLMRWACPSGSFSSMSRAAAGSVTFSMNTTPLRSCCEYH